MKTPHARATSLSRALVLATSALLVGAALAVLTSDARAQAATPAPAAAASPPAVKLSVNGMVCAFCAQGIEARLKKLPETAELYINLKQKVVAVQAKPGQTLAMDKLKAEVVEAGYEVTRAEPMTQTVAQLREQMRGRQ